MRSILKAFAHGNLLTSSQYTSDNPELSQAMEISSKVEEELLAMFDEGFKKTLDRYTNAQMDIAAASSTEGFLYGYRLGVLMTMEVFNGMEDLILGKEDE